MNHFANFVAAQVVDGEFVRAAIDIASRHTPAQLNMAVAVIRVRELRKMFSDSDAIEQAAAVFGVDPEKLHGAAILQNWRQVAEAAKEITNLMKRQITTPAKSAN